MESKLSSHDESHDRKRNPRCIEGKTKKGGEVRERELL